MVSIFLLSSMGGDTSPVMSSSQPSIFITLSFTVAILLPAFGIGASGLSHSPDLILYNAPPLSLAP